MQPTRVILLSPERLTASRMVFILSVIPISVFVVVPLRPSIDASGLNTIESTLA